MRSIREFCKIFGRPLLWTTIVVHDLSHFFAKFTTLNPCGCHVHDFQYQYCVQQMDAQVSHSKFSQLAMCVFLLATYVCYAFVFVSVLSVTDTAHLNLAVENHHHTETAHYNIYSAFVGQTRCSAQPPLEVAKLITSVSPLLLLDGGMVLLLQQNYQSLLLFKLRSRCQYCCRFVLIGKYWSPLPCTCCQHCAGLHPMLPILCHSANIMWDRVP